MSVHNKGTIEAGLAPFDIFTTVLATLLVGLLYTSNVKLPVNELVYCFSDYSIILERLKGMLDIEKVLADAGSFLTANLIQDMLLFSDHMARLRGLHNLEDLRNAVQSIKRIAADPSQPLCLVASAYLTYTIIVRRLVGTEPPAEHAGVRLGSSNTMELLLNPIREAWKACAGMLKRGLAAAEGQRDDLLVAFYSFYLTNIHYQAPDPVDCAYIRVVSTQNAAALAAAKPWLPAFHRTQLSVEHFTKHVLTGPSTIKSSIIFNLSGQPVQGIQMEPRKVLEQRTCGTCGITSRELKACGGCYSVWFCSPRCQRLHWKSGHKTECAELKAQAEAAKAERAAAEEAAAAEAAAAGPSNSTPKRVNNKKKKGKKK